MKTKRKTTGHNWELDGETIVVTIPTIWKRHGGRKVIIAPDGGDAWAPAKPRPDETLIRAAPGHCATTPPRCFRNQCAASHSL